MAQGTNKTVDGAVRGTVYWDVNNAVSVDWDAVGWAMCEAVRRAVDRTVYDAVYWTVRWSVEEDPACSGLQDFLFEVGVRSDGLGRELDRVLGHT
jgi:hypothetical protein